MPIGSFLQRVHSLFELYDNSENAYGHNVEGEREPLHFEDEETLELSMCSDASFILLHLLQLLDLGAIPEIL